ncbi:Hypothetical predicted protein, partial [Pelobates cultripes]
GHHPTWINNILFGQFIRLCRNCSLLENFEEESLDLCQRFLDKDYDPDIIYRAYQKARNLNRSSLINSLIKKEALATPPSPSVQHLKILSLLENQVPRRRRER